MTKSDKIREYFRKHPDADVAKVAIKFEASKPMVYKLRSQVVAESKSEWQPPEMVPMPGLSRKVTVSPSQIGIARAMGVPLDEYVKEGLKHGVFKYDDEREPEAKETDVDETLDERARDYGTFRDGAALMQALKRTISEHARVHDKTLSDDQWEALEMIVHKIGRIVNGNPDKVDSWVDIAGYATLIADRLQGNAR